MASSEMKGFVFAVTFIVLFAAFLSTVPSDLQGQGGTGELITPINPNLLSDFNESENYTRTDFIITAYQYDLGPYSWLIAHSAVPAFNLGAKIMVGGVIWLGGMSLCEFVSDEGTNRGNTLSIDEIESDADNGTVRYSLIFEDNGNTGGGFVVYWNTTTYSDPEDAWDNDVLYLLHGIGLTVDTNIASLLLQLLFFQLPDVPFLLGIILATPLWAMIIYITWFIIISMIPFLGGA